jgi:HAD superfamily hydrolase (TIGR01490 family)
MAFFDLDRTVLAVNSAPLLYRRGRREGTVSWSQGVATQLAFLLYGAGLRGVDDIIRSAAAACRGWHEDDLLAWNQRFWEEELCDKVRPGARQALARHRAAGDAVLLITASNQGLASIVSRAVGFDEALAPRWITDAGRLTGACEEPLCAGPGKVEHAARAAGRRGLTLADCTFYSDSYSDRPLLEAVGRPVAVHPDPRLRRLAAGRGWTIVDWDQGGA